MLSVLCQNGTGDSNQSSCLQWGLHLSTWFPPHRPIPIPSCRHSCIVNSHHKSQVLFLTSLFIFSFDLTTSKANKFPKPKFLSQSSLIPRSRRLFFILISCLIQFHALVSSPAQVLCQYSDGFHKTYLKNVSTCNLHEHARDMTPSHLNIYLWDFHAGSDTDCLLKGKFLNFSELFLNNKDTHPHKHTLQF